MKKLLTIVVSAMPTYLSLFMPSIAAAAVLTLATIMGAAMTSFVTEDEVEQVSEKVTLAWCIHLIGVCLAVAYHSVF